jgi:hypothetical protein
MIALVIGSTIAFCFWARIRATGGDVRNKGLVAKTQTAEISKRIRRPLAPSASCASQADPS